MSKRFDRVLIVIFENQYRRYVIEDPFMRKLAAAGADMANYFGVFHPSQTNYIASLAAEICAVTNDTPPAEPLLQQTLVDLLEDGGISWKAYMEDYPGDTWNKRSRKNNFTFWMVSMCSSSREEFCAAGVGDGQIQHRRFVRLFHSSCV